MPLYTTTVSQAAALADTVCAEPTLIAGMGEVPGIVDRMSEEKMLKRGAFGQAGSGVVTIVYLRSLFTAAQIVSLRNASVNVPSINSKALAVLTVEQDDVWVTVLAEVR